MDVLLEGVDSVEEEDSFVSLLGLGLHFLLCEGFEVGASVLWDICTIYAISSGDNLSMQLVPR